MITLFTRKSCSRAPSSGSVHRGGFTLVEIMIAVTIIGLLAAIAIPAFSRVRENARSSRTMNDFRILSDAFSVYTLENGSWPEDQMPGEFPPEMDGYLSPSRFTEPTAIGGMFDWDPPTSDSKPSGVMAAVSIREHILSADEGQRFIDKYGNNGQVQSVGGTLFYVIE